MPTGYTYKIEDGTITEFKDFALLCAKAFGACIHQRDDDTESLPSKREEDNYRKNQIEEAMKELEEVNN